MKVLSVTVMGHSAVQLCASYNLDDVSFWYRSSVKEMSQFGSKEIVKRCAVGSMVSLDHKGYMCHARIFASGLSVSVVADTEYPARVAFSLILEIAELFNNSYNQSQWTGISSDSNLTLDGMDECLAKYQKPEETDKIMKIQSLIDETKDVLKMNIEQLLKRGENLDDMVAISESLSLQSKLFYDGGKKLNNSCCSIL